MLPRGPILCFVQSLYWRHSQTRLLWEETEFYQFGLYNIPFAKIPWGVPFSFNTRTSEDCVRTLSFCERSLWKGWKEKSIQGSVRVWVWKKGRNKHSYWLLNVWLLEFESLMETVRVFCCSLNRFQDNAPGRRQAVVSLLVRSGRNISNTLHSPSLPPRMCGLRERALRVSEIIAISALSAALARLWWPTFLVR